jgi:hypothetical protein
MKRLLTIPFVVLLAAVAMAQERHEIGNHPIFESARLAVDYQDVWWVVAGLALIGVVVCDVGWAARYFLPGPK